MKKNPLNKVNKDNVRKANSVMISRNSQSGTFLNNEKFIIKFGRNSKEIEIHVTAEKIKEAWSKVIKNEKV